MYTQEVLESIIAMSDEDFEEALEGLTDVEIEALTEALEGMSFADKKSLKAIGKGIGAGAIKGAPEQDRNHEAVYNAAMNKVNSYDGADKTKALKALRAGVKKGVGGNIFTRGKRADAAIASMQQSSNFHKAQDKTNELNQQLQNKINSMNSQPANNTKPVKENVNMFDYDIETVEVLEGVLADLAELDEYEIAAVTEALDADDIDFLNQYISDRDDAIAVESIIDALVDMDDNEYASAIESFDPAELGYLSACEGLIDTIRKAQFKGANGLIANGKIGDRMADLKNAYHAGSTHGTATDKYGLVRGLANGKTAAGSDDYKTYAAARDKAAATAQGLRERKDTLGKIAYAIGDHDGRSLQKRRDNIQHIKDVASATGAKIGAGARAVGKGIADGAKKAGNALNSPVGYLPGEQKRIAKKLEKAQSKYRKMVKYNLGDRQ